MLLAGQVRKISYPPVAQRVITTYLSIETATISLLKVIRRYVLYVCMHKFLKKKKKKKKKIFTSKDVFLTLCLVDFDIKIFNL